MAGSTGEGGGETVSAKVAFRIADSDVQAELTVPSGRVPPGAVLPVLHMLEAIVIEAAEARLEGEGRRIACRAGCGACCRQLVPVSEVEARHLAGLVAAMPEPGRSAVRARFDAALARLAESGLIDALRGLDSVPREEREAVGLAYFSLGIPCPFLEDESCSIHEQRPLVCREFLVTSDPVHCSDPAAARVRGVQLPVHLSNLLARLPDPSGRGPSPRVALPLIMEFVETHPDELPRRPGPEWVDAVFRLVSGGGLPAPGGELPGDRAP
ncbi:Flagellin N-methylase [Aquisphaera giovannonii]|uniref:Flagellin N-methylase n=1 Tax=Aquisphaera giovannonii TaxID=406548 RepID=A0A5B9VVU5_9BACT|nr:YkgJ family cysteine cluster protein [Aquisphaera giovannonii]QEH32576.1 Flagellin N-methylase [Aquisphaera giovannonii]